MAMVEAWKALAALCCAVIIFKLWWSRRRLRQLASEIPGLPTTPFLGNITQLTGSPEKTFETLRQQWVQNGGRNFRFWIGPLLYVVITAPEDVEEILVNKRLLDRDWYIMKILSRFGGNGLVTCSSKTWRKQRKIVAPSFQFKVLESYYEVFNKKSKILVNQLKTLADGNKFDLFKLMSACTADMISENVLGTCMNSQGDAEGFPVKTIDRMHDLIYNRILKPWLFFDVIYDLTSMGKEQSKGEEYLFNLGHKLIANKLQEYRDLKSAGNITEEWMEKGCSVVDHFIRAAEAEGVELDEQLLKDEVYTAFIAGMDTTVWTMCFTLTMLALHPQIQQDVYEELKEVFEDDWGRDVTLEDVKQLKCLERVVKESMRILPALPVIPREVREEVKLSNCTIPAGCLVLIISYFVHRDPRYFPDPERFDPDRFLPERSKERHPYSYIPFGAGPRNCVGFKYAEMQMAFVLATVLREYEVLPALTYEDLNQLKIGLVARPACGFHIKMLPRDHTPASVI